MLKLQDFECNYGNFEKKPAANEDCELQTILNVAAHVPSRTSKFQSISTFLRDSFHWLPNQQSAIGGCSRWSTWSGTAFLVDHRGTSRTCVCLSPPINFAVVCDHLNKACYWFQHVTPPSCKDEVLPCLDQVNGIVFRHSSAGLDWRWRHRSVLKPAQNIPVFTVAGLAV